MACYMLLYHAHFANIIFLRLSRRASFRLGGDFGHILSGDAHLMPAHLSATRHAHLLVQQYSRFGIRTHTQASDISHFGCHARIIATFCHFRQLDHQRPARLRPPVLLAIADFECAAAFTPNTHHITTCKHFIRQEAPAAASDAFGSFIDFRRLRCQQQLIFMDTAIRRLYARFHHSCTPHCCFMNNTAIDIYSISYYFATFAIVPPAH